ncbi:FAD binding domain protein [Mycobacterium xenopi 4042]|uniref:FAD binding domain protein n=1 Tax=Mycobacterium xenopi 4042 TaxID=1299334 RepID=X7YK33_MYCXE|nr:FAD binding domain protein [Mycobacterium xenopi 4042]
MIVQAHNTDDVVAAICYARAHGHRVGVRSGGHNWSASHLRDGGLLLDVSRLDHCSVDTEQMTANVGPGKVASVFAAELDSRGLFFPAGHCEGICLGGYLLQGGYGWNSPMLGPACESVLGLEVVTADGERLYCDAENHPDLYWAARGAGRVFSAWSPRSNCGFIRGPGVGHLPVHVPDRIRRRGVRLGRSISPELDERVELQIHTARSFPELGSTSPASPSLHRFSPTQKTKR